MLKTKTKTMYYTTNGNEIKPLEKGKYLRFLRVSGIKYANPRDNSFRQDLNIKKEYYKTSY